MSARLWPHYLLFLLNIPEKKLIEISENGYEKKLQKQDIGVLDKNLQIHVLIIIIMKKILEILHHWQNYVVLPGKQ